MLVSYYHLNKLWRFTRYNNNFETFFNYFQKDLLYWSPYWTHVKDAWSKRNLPHVLFIFYEEMQRDLPRTIKNIGEFLGKPVQERDLPGLVDHLSIENFRKNCSVNMCEGQELGILQSSYADGSFIRNGKNGGFTEKFTPELARRADLWIEENLKDTDLRFPL